MRIGCVLQRARVSTFHVVIVGVALLGLAMPAQAQGIPGGAAHGFYEGGRIAGPVGAVVGGAVGGAIGGVEGLFGINHVYQPAYAVEPPPPVYRHRRHARHHRHHAYR